MIIRNPIGVVGPMDLATWRKLCYPRVVISEEEMWRVVQDRYGLTKEVRLIR